MVRLQGVREERAVLRQSIERLDRNEGGMRREQWAACLLERKVSMLGCG
jgi:hypothetical protein